ncbi:MAG: acyl-CoA dehydrogenase [Calditrichaeota bacterium]|nr:MAG: acyl-CoA dehydrogenase [Calditrichota bacterium]
MDLKLTELNLEVQRIANEFSQKTLKPLAREMDRKKNFPRELVSEMGKLGLLSGVLPKRYGGKDFDYVSTALAYEEVGTVCSSTRGFMTVQIGLVAMCISDWANEEQKQKYLPKLASGEQIGCYCLTEPEAGSDVAGMKSFAKKTENGFVLNGTKHWITNGNLADIALIFTYTDKEAKHKGMTAFLVETNSKGFNRKKMEGEELGHRASDHAFIEFKNMEVPESCVLGKVGDGFKIAMGALEHGRIGVASGAVGILRGCLEASRDFVRNRKQFNSRIGDFQMIQANLAEMKVSYEAARLLTFSAALKKQAGENSSLETSMAKYFATESAMKAASDAVLIHGGRGYSDEFPVERFYRDIKGLQIYEGTSHIQRIIIGRKVVGKP